MVETGAVTPGVGRRPRTGRRTRRGCSPPTTLDPPAGRGARRRSSTFTLASTASRSCSRAASPGAITLAPVNTVADVMALEHLAVRDYWDELHAAERAHAAHARAVRQGRRRTPVALGPPGARRRRAHRRGARPSVRGRRRADGAAARRVAVAAEPLPLGGREGRRLLVDRRRADHGQGAGRPRRHRRARRDDHPADRLRLVGPFKDDVAGHQPLPVLRLVQHVEAVAAARPQAPRRATTSPGSCWRGATSPSTRSPPAR